MKVSIKKTQKVKITGSHDVYPIMQQVLLRENKLRRKQEYFWTIGLNAGKRVEYIELVALGKLNTVGASPVEVFSIAVQKRCTKIILVHNHPTGLLGPSLDDKRFTKSMIAAGKVIGVAVLDHIIISEKDYFSFLDEGMIK